MSNRRIFVKNMFGALGTIVILPPNLRISKNNQEPEVIPVSPTNSRFVDIRHQKWGQEWSIQLPEVVSSKNGMIMNWPQINPEWKQYSENEWGYEWEPTQDYIDSQLAYGHQDDDGKKMHLKFTKGVLVKTRISSKEAEIVIELTLTNKTDQIIDGIRSDGGCLQAKGDLFIDNEEIKRSYVLYNGKMVSMIELNRTVPIRCTYHSDPVANQAKSSYEYFWGKSS